MSNDEDRLRQFEVVAYGCHERAHRRLDRFFRSEPEGTHTFLLVEYFCVDPVPIRHVRETWRNTILFFPFIRRLVQENQFLWVSEDEEAGFKLCPKTIEVMRQFEDAAIFRLPVSYAKVGTEALRYWEDHGPPRNSDQPDEASSKPIRRYGSHEWAEYLEFIKSAPESDRKTLLKEYGLLGQPWVASQRDFLVFAFPIATPSIFYGYFIVFVPAPPNEEKEKTLCDKVWDKLRELSEDLYLPVMTILAESFLEEDLVREIVKVTDGKSKECSPDKWKLAAERFMCSDRVPFLACAQSERLEANIVGCPRCGPLEQDEEMKKHLRKCEHAKCPCGERPYGHDMERALHRLWAQRKDMLSGCGDGDDDRLTFLSTLPFSKYFVASPGLIKQLKSVMTADLTMPKERDSLPASLVYGGPGSGKDIMARLVPLFSRDYFFNEVHTVNMAAVRPDAITGPLFQGIQLADSTASEEYPPKRLGLEGLLVDAKRRVKSRPRKSEGATDMNGATFILDELNSLNVDLQGILLRILEQGEVMPLFSLNREYVQHLVVGVVNEDPEEISRESELKDLLVEKGKLGTLVSGLLYETLRLTRRIREDLYHRLKRQLYLRIPEIKDRREDIPLFFYIFALKEVKRRWSKGANLIVDLGAYSLLMHPHIPWPGNIRQVQAVAQCSVKNAQRALDGHERVECVRMSRDHVLKALIEEFPRIRLDSDDNEK